MYLRNGATKPAFLTRRRGEVRERPVSRRRGPLGNLGHGMPCPYILEPRVGDGEQAQRSNGGPLVRFDRQLVEKSGTASQFASG